MRFIESINFSFIACRQTGVTSVLSVVITDFVAKLYDKEGN